MRAIRCVAFGMLLALLAASPGVAQQILIDQGARVEGLWVFPSAVNPNHYYYVPSAARLVVGENSRPKFSFLRYVINRADEDAGAQGITQAEGGGILHFLVTYDTPEDLLRRVEGALKKRDPEAGEVQLRGPVLFKKGRYALVSSIINESGREEPHLLATGNAPVLEGSQLALAFELPAERATLLMRSLEMATPDISLMFEMTLEGLADAFDADLVVNWSDVHNHRAFGAAGGVKFIVGAGGEVSDVFDEMIQSKAIELRTRGASPNMEKLLDKAYSALLDLLLEPVSVEPGDEQEGDALGGLMGKTKEDPSGRKEIDPSFALPITLGATFTAGYKSKQLRKSGRTVISMSGQEPVERVTTIGFNIGDLWEKHGNDARIFKTVNLADPAFQQREIHVGIDGSILPEFERYINSVTTTLRKRHQNGETTVQEIVVDSQTFQKSENDYRMIYGWNGDEDRTAWLRYDFRTRWSFKGGGVYETGWQTTDSNMIDLYAPYRRKVVRVLGDPAVLKEQGVRAVVVNVEYPFFDGRKKDKLRFRPDRPEAKSTLEITLPLDIGEYQYRIQWIGQKGERRVQEGSDATGLLFVDELPEVVGEQAS